MRLKSGCQERCLGMTHEGEATLGAKILLPLTANKNLPAIQKLENLL
jgi:hypothetical protein